MSTKYEHTLHNAVVVTKHDEIQSLAILVQLFSCDF